jgi:Spy/CpxP family protein refolding chaperone
MFRRLVIISTIALTLVGTTAMAQKLRQRAGGRRAFAGQRFDRLQQKLNLSETQMNGIRALQENRRKETQSLRPEVQQKRQTLRQLLQQPNPNPSDVGNATLALKESRSRMRDINQRFASGIKGLLTPDQVQKLPKRFQ